MFPRKQRLSPRTYCWTTKIYLKSGISRTSSVCVCVCLSTTINSHCARQCALQKNRIIAGRRNLKWNQNKMLYPIDRNSNPPIYRNGTHCNKFPSCEGQLFTEVGCWEVTCLGIRGQLSETPILLQKSPVHANNSFQTLSSPSWHSTIKRTRTVQGYLHHAWQGCQLVIGKFVAG